MSKRSLAQGFSGLLIGAIGTALFAVAILIMLIRAYPLPIGTFAVTALGLAYFLKRRSSEVRTAQLRSAEGSSRRQIELHKNALISYFRQSVRGDLFGNEDTSVWRRHIRTFLDTQVVPDLTIARIPFDDSLAQHLAAYVDRIVRSENAVATMSGEHSLLEPEKLSSIEYEHHCATTLFRCGWTVRPTPVTGDHGADVVAEKNGKVLVVQCKLYSQPVGNKAVQEVNAARSLYNAAHACVVAPAGFTAQAQREAHALSIRLLHHGDLESFAEELVEQSTGPSKRTAIG
jgi:restriction system protein